VVSAADGEQQRQRATELQEAVDKSADVRVPLARSRTADLWRQDRTAAEQAFEQLHARYDELKRAHEARKRNELALTEALEAARADAGTRAEAAVRLCLVPHDPIRRLTRLAAQDRERAAAVVRAETAAAAAARAEHMVRGRISRGLGARR
jgi:hypothetical protein